MSCFRNTIQILLAFVCYFVGYLIFANPWVSLAMLVCFWVGVIISIIMEDYFWEREPPKNVWTRHIFKEDE